ncbi:hypothetical protein CYMTET_50951 [Cymbomonas tetramitiformis]|uniref:Uncharacterized protein n=1 Tax=Cymbomonas tetramitiformis TaxID=36881 RepID=A0AAE0BNM6_9CHLO|nr:hypothetical protein CYMTET_50951 [Cymbomonas tetramitiformis]
MGSEQSDGAYANCVPTPIPASNEDADVETRRYLQEQCKLVDDVYKARLHRQWAKGVREDVLDDKKHHFRGTDDAGLLSDRVVQLRTEFRSAGLELASFDLDDTLARVVGRVDGLLYDVLALVIEKHSNAFVWLTGTDASSDRDGRQALVDIVKGSHLRFLAREQRLVRDNKATDWTPTEETRKLSLYNRLDPVFYTAVNAYYPQLKAWAQTDTGKAVSGKDGVSAQLSSSEYGALLSKINELQDLLRQQRGTDAPPAQQQRQQPQRQQRQQPQRGGG